MRTTIVLTICLIINLSVFAKGNFNTDDGYLAEGYDVVSYFQNEPKEGLKQYETIYDGVKLKFSSKKNLDLFNQDPKHYLPQYGGWCAYAMGARNKKVGSDPETFEIRDDKLYLFYNAFFNNTLESWLEEGAEALKIKADKNWERFKK